MTKTKYDLTNFYVSPGKKAEDYFTFNRRDVTIQDDQNQPYVMKGIEAPADWSDRCLKIAVKHYFRGAIGADNREMSAKQVVRRVAGTFAKAGVKHGYFGPAIAEVFEEELAYILYAQKAAFNSPVWYNVGIDETPLCSACYILDVEDSLSDGDHSILGTALREATIFKSGGGAGHNVSNLRELNAPLANGGVSSGPLSFMKGFDSFAGVIKSGGKTRRAAKLVCMDDDHPDIFEFSALKSKEEKKMKALIDAGYDGSFGGEAEKSVTGQNANLSIRVTDKFMAAVLNDERWTLRSRVPELGGKDKEVSARDLFMHICREANASGDPGLQFHDEINRWNTVANCGQITASNPCQPEWATVLTPEGISTFKDIEVGSTIWSGKQWTKVKRKIATGTKPVFEYRTAAGTFVGTENHRIFSHGRRVEVGSASSIDTCVGAPRLGGVYVCEDLSEEASQRLVFGGPLDVRSYLKGLFNEQASLRGYDVVLSVRTFRAAEDVQQMLSSLGVASTRRVIDAEGSKRYEVVVSNLREFQDIIGFDSYRHPGKMHDLQAACETMPNSHGTPETCDIIEVVSLGEHPVWDIEVEADEHSYWTGGLLVSNCSEYMFLGDTSCNLASLNLANLGAEPFAFPEVDQLSHVLGVVTLSMDIIVASAGYPTEGITKKTRDYRTLGVGYGNLGALLMANGIAYNSTSGRKVAGALASFMTARTYLMSAITADKLGAFPKYEENKGHVGAVMEHHRMRTRDLMDAQVEWPMYFDTEVEEMAEVRGRLPQEMGYRSQAAEAYTNILAEAAIDMYDMVIHAINNGAGIRNAQASVIAPTGTIGFLMDYDTWGIEPAASLAIMKETVAGDFLTILFRPMERCLKSMGVPAKDIERINASFQEHGHLGECGYDFTQSQIEVLATAFGGGSEYETDLSPEAHIYMMAAVQPFLSGAISKTVNLPSTATEESFYDAYMLAWATQTKAVAAYRDGCKNLQPVKTMKKDDEEEEKDTTDLTEETPKPEVPETKPEISRGVRLSLNEDLTAVRHSFSIGGTSGYLLVSEKDGKPVEIFVNVSKAGSHQAAFMRQMGILLSDVLRLGMDLEAFVNHYSWAEYEPSGFTGNKAIPSCTSLQDYIAKWIGVRYLGHYYGRKPLENVEPREVPDHVRSPEPAKEHVGSCTICGGSLVRTGSCTVCSNCGASSGCS